MIGLPTRRADWRLMGRTARLVLGGPGYALTGALPPAARVELLVSQFPFVGPAFPPLQGSLLVAVAVLTGVDVTMATYHFREHGVSVREGGSSAAGVFLGTLGAGCAACGSAVLAGLLSLVGGSGLLLLLPLDGLEFALGASVVLLLSVYWLADGMRGGEIRGCPVDL